MQRPRRSAASRARQTFSYSDIDDEMSDLPKESDGSEDEWMADGEQGSGGSAANDVGEDDGEEEFSEEEEDSDLEDAGGPRAKAGLPKVSRISKAGAASKFKSKPTHPATKRTASDKQSRIPSAIAQPSQGARPKADVNLLTRSWAPGRVERVTTASWPYDGAPVIEHVDISPADVSEIFLSWRTTPNGLSGTDLVDLGWTPSLGLGPADGNQAAPAAPMHSTTFPTVVNALVDCQAYVADASSNVQLFHARTQYGTSVTDPIISFQEKPPPGPDLDIALGPVGFQARRRIGRFEAENLDQIPSVIPDRAGHILNAGGHVYSVAWRPVPASDNIGKEFLAVSASSEAQPRTAFGTRNLDPAPAAIQIWGIAPTAASKTSQPTANMLKEGEYGSAKLEMLLCHDKGSAWKIAWCPIGHDPRPAASHVRRLGLLAGTFHDGTLSVFVVPHPQDARTNNPEHSHDQPLAVEVEPILVLSLPTTAPHCFEWAGGGIIAAGCADGSIAVWNVGQALRQGSRTTRPSHFFRLHDAPILSICWLLRPSPHHTDTAEGDAGEDGLFDQDCTPRYILASAMDGTIHQVDLSVPSLPATPLMRIMAPVQAGCYSPSLQAYVCSRSKDEVAAMRGNMGDYRRSVRLFQHHGPVQCIATSPLHPVVASGSADGSVIVCNLVHALSKGSDVSTVDLSATKLFRLDHDRDSGELRLLDNFREGLPVVPSTKAKKSKKQGTVVERSALWHPSISVNAVDWCPNIGRGLLLASGTGCGLVRIDWVGKGGGVEGHGEPAFDLIAVERMGSGDSRDGFEVFS